MSVTDAVLDIFAPRRCGGCRSPGRSICGVCRDEIAAMPGVASLCSGTMEIHAAFAFAGTLRHLLHGGKYRDGRTLLGELAGIAAPRLPLPRADAVIAVPLHVRRLRDRGYNQAEVVARIWAQSWEIPMRGGLVRSRETAPQVGGDILWRRRNVAGAFEWAAELPPPRRVVLVDDVVTSGATVSAAAQALRQAGSLQISIYALARPL